MKKRHQGQPCSLIPCNLDRHTKAICILTKVQLEWSGSWWLALTRAWFRLWWSASPTSWTATWYGSPIRRCSWPSIQMLWEPPCIGWSVSVARKPCWWTVATWASSLAPELCCSLRLSLQSWVVWVPFSRAWNAVKATVRCPSPHCTIHYRMHDDGNAYCCSASAAAAADPPPWVIPISGLPWPGIVPSEAENTALPAGCLFHLCGYARPAGDDGGRIGPGGTGSHVPYPVTSPQASTTARSHVHQAWWHTSSWPWLLPQWYFSLLPSYSLHWRVNQGAGNRQVCQRYGIWLMGVYLYSLGKHFPFTLTVALAPTVLY